MTDKLGDQPAFPHMAAQGHRDYEPGLTVRQHIAIEMAKALIIANNEQHQSQPLLVAREACIFAQCLIAELEKSGQ